MSELFESVVAEYRALYGEPEYRYFKKHISWVKFRRDPGYHSTPVGDGTEVTREEFDANIAQSKHFAGEAFMSRYPQSYWRYDQKMSKPGWRERLIEDVQKCADTSSQST